jgi:hypothetical protein
MAGMISMGPNKGLTILQEHGLSSTGIRTWPVKDSHKLRSNFQGKNLFNNPKNKITDLIDRNK